MACSPCDETGTAKIEGGEAGEGHGDGQERGICLDQREVPGSLGGPIRPTGPPGIQEILPEELGQLQTQVGPVSGERHTHVCDKDDKLFGVLSSEVEAASDKEHDHQRPGVHPPHDERGEVPAEEENGDGQPIEGGLQPAPRQ